MSPGLQGLCPCCCQDRPGVMLLMLWPGAEQSHLTVSNHDAMLLFYKDVCKLKLLLRLLLSRRLSAGLYEHIVAAQALLPKVAYSLAPAAETV